MTSFRERLLVLAEEHEELQMRYDALVAERLYSLKRSMALPGHGVFQGHDRDGGNSDDITDGPLDSSAPLVETKPINMATFFKANRPTLQDIDEMGEESSMRSVLAAQVEDGQSKKSKWIQRLNNGGDIDEMGEASTVGSMRAEQGEDGQPRSSKLTSKGKGSWIRTKPLAEAMYQDGYRVRRRVLLKLNLLEDHHEDDDLEEFNQDVTATQHIALERNVQDLWKRFTWLDAQGRGFITGSDLNRYDGKGDGKRKQRFKSTIEHFNTVIRSLRDDETCPHHSEATEYLETPTTPKGGQLLFNETAPAVQKVPSGTSLATNLKSAQTLVRKGVTLDFITFVDMMLMEGLEEIVGRELAEEVSEIRHMFRMAGVMEAIAGKTNVTEQEMTNRIRFGRQSIEEAVVGVVIISNALIIGISCDVEPDWTGWNGIEVFFSLFFLAELVYKSIRHGVRDFVFGIDWRWNLFDSLIVALALIDIVIMFEAAISQTQSNEDLNSVSVIRIVRLSRVTRMVRLMHNRHFKELAVMVRGIVHGLTTLFWAMVLMICLVYTVGVLLRQTVGRDTRDLSCTSLGSQCDFDEVELYDTRENYETVGKAMFTTFRCLVDGCSDAHGRPLMMTLMNVYGWPVVLAYVLIMVFVLFGLFNLIMAVFVENTLQAAKYDETRRQQLISKEHVRTAQTMKRLVEVFCNSADTPTPKLKNAVTKSGSNISVGAAVAMNERDLEITRERFSEVIMTKQVAVILEDLDINVSNPKSLFDVLDTDERGAIDLKHMISGLMHLRGSADKSDMVACTLGVRAVRQHLKSFEFILMKNMRELWKDVGRTQDRINHLGRLMYNQSNGIAFSMEVDSPLDVTNI